MIDDIKNNIMPQISKRVSAESFINKPVEKIKLSRIAEAGRLAPSAKNRQPWRFIVIDDPVMLAKMTDACYNQQIVAEAPAMIAACTTNIDYRMPNGIESYPADLSFAVSFMSLQAVHENLSTRLTTTFEEVRLKELLSVPYQMKIVLLLLVGYTDTIKEHSSRKHSSAVISFNHW